MSNKSFKQIDILRNRREETLLLDPYFIDNKKFIKKGVLLQLNLLSITGYYSKKVRKNAEKLIDEDMISFVGSDCHNMHHVIKLRECLTNPLWHKLSLSKNLLNNTL